MARTAHTLGNDYIEEGDITGDEDYGSDALLEDIGDTVGYGEEGIRWFSTEEVSNAVASKYRVEDQEGFLGDLLERTEESTSEDLNIIDKMLGQKRENGDVLGEYREEGYRWQLNE